MKRLTIDLLLAGSLALAPAVWAQDYGGNGAMQNRNDTTPAAPTRTGGTPTTTQRNTPPYPGPDPAAPQRVPSDVPPGGTPTPATSDRPESTTTGSVRSGNEPTDDSHAAGTESTDGDLTLVQKVHEANQKEIEMGQLAADKAKSPRVKSYARKLVSDHKSADRQLMTYARKKGLESRLEQTAANTNAGETKTQTDMHARLMGETGSEFDHDFAATMVDEHDKAIEMVKSGRDSAADPELRSLFDKALPILEKHRKMAQDLVDKHVKS
jgi:putative membrane protein